MLTDFLCLCMAKKKMEANSKFSSLRALCGTIDQYLMQLPNNKPWSIIGNSDFAKANQTLIGICKHLIREGKVGPWCINTQEPANK